VQGIFVVCDATNGAPLGIFQENRYLTDLRTGAAGAVSIKYFASKKHTKVAFIGTGVIATAVADSTHVVHQFSQGYAFGLDQKMTEKFPLDWVTLSKCVNQQKRHFAMLMLFSPKLLLGKQLWNSNG